MRHGFTPMTDKYYILFMPNLMEQKTVPSMKTTPRFDVYSINLVY